MLSALLLGTGVLLVSLLCYGIVTSLTVRSGPELVIADLTLGVGKYVGTPPGSEPCRHCC